MITLKSIQQMDITPGPIIKGTGANIKKRKEKSHIVHGESLTCREAAEKFGYHHLNLKNFMNYHGYSLEKAVEKYESRQRTGGNMKGKSQVNNFGRGF